MRGFDATMMCFTHRCAIGAELEETSGMRMFQMTPLAVTLVALGGCSSGPPRQTTVDLTHAQTLVAAAEQSGAQKYAAAVLQSARDKAHEAAQFASKDPKRADRLANEAAVDAQLASARAQDARTRHSLAEMRRSLRTLRREEDHNTGASPSGQTPGGPQSTNGSQHSQSPAPLNSTPRR